jgi:parallel beta-helix repeat protein
LVLALACSACATGVTGAPRAVRATEARFFGQVMSNVGGEVEYWTEYGTTTAYGSASPHETVTVQPNKPYDLFVEVTGLQRSTTYHYRLCARDSQQQGGPGCGQDKTFATPNLDCGEVITHDVALSAPLYCEDFADGGLVIGADGIDLSLGGNRLIGPLTDFYDTTDPVAIDNSGGYDDVTIRNGSISAWGTMVGLNDADYNVIRNIDSIRNGAGIDIDGGEGVVVRSTHVGAVHRFYNGLVATGTEGLVVADSSAPTWYVQGSDSRIVRNQVGSGDEFSTCFILRGNRNRIADNHTSGCPNGGLVLQAGGANELIGNEASNAYFGLGGEPDGIRVEAFTAGTLLQGNFVHDNEDDGIDVQASDARLQDNRADDNDDFGIDAAAGVTDLGGNTASGNGNPLQCRNVFCQ